MDNGVVYVVHCIDTEGPLYESLTETFKRIEYIVGKKIEPSLENLKRIQNCKIDLNGKEKLAAEAFSKRLLNYNKDWTDIDNMLHKLLSNEFRLKYKDSYGRGWVYNWFIVDFVDFITNPRCRDLGYNNIYNHYNDFYAINKIDFGDDEFQWHAHPMSIYREAHKCETSYINSPHIFQSLCHRIIDCGDFPQCFRPGFHTERPDSHWFLEQFIPYDFGNQSIELTQEDLQQKDLSDGRFGDWRRASSSWKFYHPSHDDYQLPGNCNRFIFRCLNVGTRLRLITQNEVNKAFELASKGEDVILAFTDHDFRDMSLDIDEIYGKLINASKKYPDIKWMNCGALKAAQTVTKSNKEKLSLKCKLVDNKSYKKLFVETNIDTFGPQPFLAIKTTDNRYIMENFDFQIPKKSWTYTFDENSILPYNISEIGIATNSIYGTGSLVVLDSKGCILKTKEW